MNKKINYGYFRDDKEAEPGFSKELISADFKGFAGVTNMDELNCWPYPGVDTMIKALERLESKMPNHDLFGTKVGDAYTWMTVKDVLATSKLIAAGLESMDLTPTIEAEGKEWKFLGIQSKNRKEWNLLHLANQLNGVTTIAFYDTLGPDASKYICDQTEMTTIACSADLVGKVLALKQNDPDGKVSRLVNVISFSDVTNDQNKLAEDLGVKIVTFDELMRAGKDNSKWQPADITPDTCTMFSYTSGTTGDPKGVKLTHKMLLQCANAVNTRLVSTKDGLDHTDSYISYLPAAHSFEQALQGIVFCYGVKCGFYGGDPLKLIKEDLPALKPTLFASVPRIFNRVYGLLQEKVNVLTGCKSWLVNKAITEKTAALKATGATAHCCYDKLVFKKFKAVLGGNVRVMITGSAPISPDVLDFLKIAFCCPIVEGYGMTETSAGSFTTLVGDPVSGHVGGPLCNVKCKLRDIPEMNYMSSNSPPQGELCIWGSSVMSGYFKNPEKTEEAFHDGWLQSGDVAQINPNGSVKIIDRAKNIFKLSQGEYIAPEKIENIFIQSGWLDQVWIHGDSLNDFIVLIAVINMPSAEKWAQENNVGSVKEALESKDLKNEINKDLLRLAAESKLNGLEKPKNMLLLDTPFTGEDVLTPTFKMKRNVAKVKFEKEIKAMYEEGVILKR